MRNYIKAAWDEQYFVLRQNKFFSNNSSIDRGVTQGYVDSPIIFNALVDAEHRVWKKMRYFIQKPSLSRFYADDGLVENTDSIQLKQDLNAITNFFIKVGLKANDKKTKYMIMRGAAAPKSLSTATYDNIDKRRKKLQTSTLSFVERRKK